MPVDALHPPGTLPSYYLRYFYAHDAVVAEQRSSGTRGEEVARIESELLELYRDPSLTTKPDLLSRRGGAYYSEAAIGLLAALVGEAPGPHAANVRNDGRLPFLDDDAVIEVTCGVDRDSARPRPGLALNPVQRGLIAHVSAYEELALDAAIRGGRDRVFRALLAHPLVGQHALAEALTDRLLAANAVHLAWAR